MVGGVSTPPRYSRSFIPISCTKGTLFTRGLCISKLIFISGSGPPYGNTPVMQQRYTVNERAFLYFQVNSYYNDRHLTAFFA